MRRAAIRRKQKARAYHHGELRAALIAAARTILEREGLESLSLRATARRAGVSQAAPYHHFTDKQALLAAVAASGFDGLTDQMQEGMAGRATAMDRFCATGVAYVAFATANPALFRLMFAGQKPSSDPALAAAASGAHLVLQEATREALRAEGRAESELPLASLAAWSLVHGLAKLIVETDVRPADYGADSPQALAQSMLVSDSIVRTH